MVSIQKPKAAQHRRGNSRGKKAAADRDELFVLAFLVDVRNHHRPIARVNLSSEPAAESSKATEWTSNCASDARHQASSAYQ